MTLDRVYFEERVFPLGFRQAPHFHPKPYFSCVRHGTYRETRREGSTTYSGFSLGFDPVGFHSSEVLEGPVRTLVVELDEDVGAITAMAMEHGEAVFLAKRLDCEYRINDRLTADSIKLILGEMVELVSSPRPDHTLTPSWLREADDAVRSELSVEPLSAIAARVGVLPSVLSRGYRRKFGATPSEVARRSRLEIAKLLLRRDSNSIGEIAHQLGYCDQSHFCRDFKSNLGVPPGAFRRECSGHVQNRYKRA